MRGKAQRRKTKRHTKTVIHNAITKAFRGKMEEEDVRRATRKGTMSGGKKSGKRSKSAGSDLEKKPRKSKAKH